jgi:protease IV
MRMFLSSSSSLWQPVVALLVLPLLGLLAGGCGTPSFLVTPVSSSTKLMEEEVQPGKGGGKIAIVQVEGMLMNARAGGFLQPGENSVSLFAQQMNKAAADGSVKAVVLRVNSPGGTVTASDLMYEVVNQFRAKTKKPVVAATQEVAASGGYYVSLGADQIVAHPTSVVGSIGVIFTSFELEELMNKIGVKNRAIKSGPLKDMGSPFKALGPEEREVMQAMVDDYYGRFKDVVKTRRNVTDPDTFKLVTDGRVFTGTRAVELGLADRTGSLDDALNLARELGKAPGAKAVIYKRPYGYGGSIYANSDAGVPRAAGGADGRTLQLELPGSQRVLPGGFYYLWQPGL